MQTGLVDETSVVDALAPRLTFKGLNNSEYDFVDCDEPLSGRYYDDGSFNRAVTVQNIIDCYPDTLTTDAQKKAVLDDLIKANVMQTISRVLGEPRLVESGMLFEKIPNTNKQFIANAGSFAGLRFKIAPSDYAVKIHDVTLFFDGDVTFNLYLFNEYAGILRKFNVSTKANKQTRIPLGEILRSQSEEVLGGEYYLCYNQDDLGDVKAINVSASWKSYTFGCTSFASAALTTESFSYENYSTSYDNYGINARVSVYKDLTTLVVENDYLFDELLGLMMVTNVAELMQTTTRSNATERIGKEALTKLFFDISGRQTDTGQWIPGINSKIAAEVKAIKNVLFPKPEATIYSVYG